MVRLQELFKRFPRLTNKQCKIIVGRRIVKCLGRELGHSTKEKYDIDYAIGFYQLPFARPHLPGFKNLMRSWVK